MADVSCCSVGVSVRTLRYPTFCLTEAQYRAGQCIPPHASDYPTLSLALEGGYWEQQGRTWLRCEPSTLMFHPAGDVHANVMSERGSRCLNVLLDESFLAALPDGARARLDGGTGLRGVPRWHAFELRAALGAGHEAAVKAEELLLVLLADVARLPGITVSRTPPTWLERVRERIHDEFARRLDLEELARTGGVHRVHLARAFRAHYRCTIGAYVRQRRVEFACRALTSTKAGLSEIALAAGFTDQSHFTHTFRRLVGLPPGAFRARFAA